MRGLLRPLLAFSLLAISCNNPAVYRSPVSKFHDASTLVIASSKAVYTGLNKAERDHYIDQQFSRRQPIDPTELAKAQVFSADEIAARLKALDVLAGYSELLFQLANMTAPSTVKSKVSDLQQALSNLSGEVSKLDASTNSTFQNASKTVFPVLGTALQAFENGKIDEALRKAVLAAAKPLNDLIAAMEIDMQVSYERQRNFLSGQRREKFQQYNADVKANADLSKLRAEADSISLMEDQWEAFRTARPTEGLEAMKQAHAALIGFAQKPKPSVTDFATFVDAMDSFANTAQQIGEVFLQLKGK
jgi:hypothetical protein